MNDLDLITELRPEMPLATPVQLADARGRVMAAANAESAGRAAAAGPYRLRAPRAPGSWRPRLAMSAVGASAVAAGVAVAMVATSASGPVTGRRSGAPSSHAGSSGQPATVTAAQWLSTAATATLHEAAFMPRPDQYVYAETVGPGQRKYQIWQSADGSRAGLIEAGDGLLPVPLRACTVAQAQAGPCALAAGYLPQLPTRPDAMLGYLARIGVAFKVAQTLTAIVLGKDLSGPLSREYLTPAQRAAIFQLMAHTPGFILVPHTSDALGRRGVGIAWHDGGVTMMLIFNPRTYGYLGLKMSTRGLWRPLMTLVTMKIVSKLPPHQPFNPGSPNGTH